MINRITSPAIPIPPRSRGVFTVGEGQAQASDGFNAQQRSRGLATMQPPGQKIALPSILDDFRSTMSALGAEAPIQREVEAYLRVVGLQSQKDAPSVPLIKQSLKSAAETLDGFITQALGQPSQVVRDWVDALLLQNIDYRAPVSDTNLDPLPPETPPTQTSTGTLSPESKAQLVARIRDSQQAAQAGRFDEADLQLTAGLQAVEGIPRPDLKGKLWAMRGQLAERQGNTDTALNHYQQAAEQFAQAGQAEKQGQALYRKAALLDRQSKLPEAQAAYGDALALAESTGNVAEQARLLNDLGSLALRQGQGREALATLGQAYQKARQPDGLQSLLPDVFHNLGTAHRQEKQYPQAAQAYQSALTLYRQQRNREGYGATLQNLAKLYLEAEKPQQAMKVLQRLEAFQSKG